MFLDLSDLLQSFSQSKILVLGEAMLDCYLEGSSDRLCQEAPVPVVTLHDRQNFAGGAGNAAVNLQSLGGQVQFLSVIGADQEGELLGQVLEHQGVTTEQLLVQPSRRTLAKHRVLAGAQMLLRFDQGTTTALDPDMEQRLIDRLIHLFPTCDAVLVSDYGYGILTPRVIQTLANLQALSPRILVVDSRQLAAYRDVGVTAVKPNYAEAIQLLGLPRLEDRQRLDQIAAQGERLLQLTGAEIVAATLDQEGALIFERDRPLPYRTTARPTTPTQTTGAGDTYISVLTLGLALAAPLPIVAELAATAAAIGIAKEGTATCSRQELIEQGRTTDDLRLGQRQKFAVY